MKYILFVIATIGIGLLLQQLLPWWSIALIAAILSFALNIRISASFWLGFLAVALLWGGYAGILSAANEGILAARIGKLLGGLNGTVLIFVTGLLGGIFGGLGALTGSLGRGLLKPQPQN